MTKIQNDGIATPTTIKIVHVQSCIKHHLPQLPDAYIMDSSGGYGWTAYLETNTSRCIQNPVPQQKKKYICIDDIILLKDGRAVVVCMDGTGSEGGWDTAYNVFGALTKKLMHGFSEYAVWPDGDICRLADVGDWKSDDYQYAYCPDVMGEDEFMNTMTSETTPKSTKEAFFRKPAVFKWDMPVFAIVMDMYGVRTKQSKYGKLFSIGAVVAKNNHYVSSSSSATEISTMDVGYTDHSLVMHVNDHTIVDEAAWNEAINQFQLENGLTDNDMFDADNPFA
jgi:hypothetical protein